MKKYTLWGSLILGSAVALTGCNSGSDSDSNTSDKLPAAGATVNFTLLQTTDLHHHAETYARLATKINTIKEASEDPVMLVDSGDFVMGTVYDMTLTSSPINSNETPAAFQFLEDVDYDVVALGNHEFDYGDQALARWLDNSVGGNFPHIVATNMVADNSPSIKKHVDGEVIRQSFTQPLFEDDDDKKITVGFIGLMGPEAATTITNAPEITFNNKIKYIQDQVDRLKNDEDVDVIVALSHSGLTDTSDPTNPVGDDADYAKKLTGIDIIATGHTHTLVGKAGADQKPIEVKNGDHTTYIFGGGAYGDFLAQLDITFTKNRGITGVKLVNHDIKAVEEDSEDTATIKKHVTDAQKQIKELAQIDDFKTIVAKRDNVEFAKPDTLGESSLGNLLADATRYSYTAYGQDETGENGYTIETKNPVSLVANGVIRGDFAKSPEISFSDMYDVLSLGLSIDPNQQNLPGSPLFRAYLTAQELENIAHLMGYGLASQDQAYLGNLPQQKAIVAAGINVTTILNDVLAGNELDLMKLMTDGQIDIIALGKRLGAIGIDFKGILSDKELNILGKLIQGEELDIDLDNLLTKGYIKPMQLLTELAKVGLSLEDVKKLLDFDNLSLNAETIKTVLALLDLLEPPTGELKTSDKVLASLKLFIISQIQPEWYLNASGLRATFDNEYEVAKIELYQKDDIHSQGDEALTALSDKEMKDTHTLYPVIADQYMLLLMYGPEFSLLRKLPGFEISPKTKDGTVIEFDINTEGTHNNLLNMAISSQGDEVKAWQALQTFFKAQANGNEPYQIPDKPYSIETMADGQDSSRVNLPVSQ